MDIPARILDVLADTDAHVVVSTGAGVSAESGVPTFRSAGGLWQSVKPENLATVGAFERDPRKVWEWYEYRRRVIAAIKPNPGHMELARWEHHFRYFALITQNVDGLHRAAGSSQPIELHGNIMLSRCHVCGRDAGGVGPGSDGQPPVCACGGPVRPGVVWFGEQLPQPALEKAWDLCRNADVFFSVGTSGVVQPAAALAFVAKESGAFLVEINPEETEISYIFNEVLRMPSGVALPALGLRLGISRDVCGD